MVAIDMDTPAGQREALREMLLIRRFEERVGDLFADGEIPGFVHLYVGQEAVATGATAALDEDDYITSTHRGHGHCVAMGLDLDRLYAELMGKAAGTNDGKGGSMHMADVDAGMLGANGIVGSGAPLATGAGLSKRVLDEPGVGLAFFGDGGVSQGQVHESINLAAAWDLPVIYVVEKNQYVEMMPDESIFGTTEFANVGDAYDVPGRSVDGMDVEAVHEAVEKARSRAVADGGPTLISAETYRYREHAEGTPHPRDEAELDAWHDRDPVFAYRDRLLERGMISEGEFERMEEAIAEEITGAVAAARDADRPDPGAAYEDIYTEPVPDVAYHRSRMDAGADSDPGGK